MHSQQRELVPDCWLAPEPSDEAGSHGEVFTRRWVVDLILDLAGYTSDADLASMVAVEPACGSGAFLVPMVERLVASCYERGTALPDTAIHATDLQLRNVEQSQAEVVRTLKGLDVEQTEAERLAKVWCQRADFLLEVDLQGAADFVVGNPPYVRLEDVPTARSDAYRRACRTMSGRADLFVGFIEQGLRSLKPGGTLAYICADRWMRNQYGKALRELVGSLFSVDATLMMHDVDAFEDQVSAYPAITVIRQREQGPTILADTTKDFGEGESRALMEWARTEDERIAKPSFHAAKLPTWFAGGEAWPSGTPEQLALIANLERRFPPLEDKDTATRVGIGVATGADGVFVTKQADLVEPERMLPLSMVRDTVTGTFQWSGHYLVNPWDESGLVELSEYPRLEAYFEANEEALRKRNVASKRPKHWYRTIDRVDVKLTGRPKLLLPDMKMSMSPVLEDEAIYPHHNLYCVTSEQWAPDVLGGLLLSKIPELFIRAYCVKMRGGTLRFQAQYLRRIRVPALSTLGKADRAALAKAFENRDVEAATGVTMKLYGIEELPSAR